MKKKIASAVIGLCIASNIAFAGTLAEIGEKFKINGDLRLRLDYNVDSGAVNKDDYVYKYRIRLNAGCQLNDNMTASVRFVNGEREFGANGNKFDIDNWTIEYKKGDNTLTAGRQDFKLFKGLAFDMTDSGTIASKLNTADQYYAHLQGVKATTQVKHKLIDFDALVVFGSLSDRGGSLDSRYDKQSPVAGSKEIHGGAVMKKIGAIDFGIGYFAVNRNWSGPKFEDVYAAAKVGQIEVYGEYVHNNLGDWADSSLIDKNKAWKLGLSHGQLIKPGDLQYTVEYRNIEAGALGNKFTSNYRDFGGKNFNTWYLEIGKQLDKDIAGRLYYEKYDVKGDSGKNEQTVRGELIFSF